MTTQETFEKWFDEKLNDIEFQAIADENLCLLVWQAATAERDKRIAELETRVSELDGMLGNRNLRREHEYLQRMNELTENFEELELNYDQLNIDYCLVRDNRDEKIKQITALQTHINVLREALEVAKYELEMQGCDDKADDNAFLSYNRVVTVLLTTPAQSLIQHDNEVIERCAVAMENYHVLEGIPAMYIRALKGK